MSDFLLYGRHAVIEALKSGQPLSGVTLQSKVHGPAIDEIIQLARSKGTVIRYAEGKSFTEALGEVNHQGVMAVSTAKAFAYSDWDTIFDLAEARSEKPLIAILDEISDPHNLGAIIRSAECAGFHGVIIPKHRSAEVNATVIKTSAGAASYIPVVQVVNLSQAIRELKGRNVWIYGTSMDAKKTYDQIDPKDAIAIVIGSEGSGMRKMVTEHCDFLVKIPLHGQIDSLNASVAAGILFFDVVRQRAIKKP